MIAFSRHRLHTPTVEEMQAQKEKARKNAQAADKG